MPRPKHKGIMNISTNILQSESFENLQMSNFTQSVGHESSGAAYSSVRASSRFFCEPGCRRSQRQAVRPSASIENAPQNLSTYNEGVSMMWHQLQYFFMTPWKKFRVNGRLPLKMLIQALKIIGVTIQLVLFGFVSSAHVTFGERTEMALRHLYLRNWDPSYETLPYPPSTGEYAVYTKDEFFESLAYALLQYNRTTDNSLAGVKFDSTDRFIEICLEELILVLPMPETSSGIQKSFQNCVKMSLLNVSEEDLKSSDTTRDLLISQNLIIPFERPFYLRLKFLLMSAPVYFLSWDTVKECFSHLITITLDNSRQTGQILVSLTSRYVNTPCEAKPKEPTSSADYQTENSSSWNLVVDICTFMLASLSGLLCVRSIYRGHCMLRRTEAFFISVYCLRLRGLFWVFVSPWYLVMLLGDLLIVFGSFYKLIINDDVLEKYSVCCYLLGVGTLIVWVGILRYVGFSYQNNILLRTITRSIPSLLRFCLCALFLYFAFAFCVWVIIGPYNIKFRTFVSTLECLFSLINGDDMFTTFSIITEKRGYGIFIISRVLLYLFITLFIYVVLNIFITIIFEAYEEVKEQKDFNGRSISGPLWHFLRHPPDTAFTLVNCCSANYSPSSSTQTTQVTVLGEEVPNISNSSTVHADNGQEVYTYPVDRRRSCYNLCLSNVSIFPLRKSNSDSLDLRKKTIFYNLASEECNESTRIFSSLDQSYNTFNNSRLEF